MADRGASVYFHVEYANELDTPIHERTCARRIKIRRLHEAWDRRKVTPHKAGVSHVRYGRRKRPNSVVFYVVCVSRSRIGLYVSYVHVESHDSLRRNLEHGNVHGRRMRRS